MADTYEDMSLMIQTLLLAGAEITAIEIQSFITTNRLAGMSDDAILELLEADLLTGGRIFGRLSNDLKNTVRGAIGTAALIAGIKIYQ